MINCRHSGMKQDLKSLRLILIEDLVEDGVEKLDCFFNDLHNITACQC